MQIHPHLPSYLHGAPRSRPKEFRGQPTDIAYPSLVDKYANRPSELHPLSLAEFVAWYEPIRPPAIAPKDVDDANEDMFFPSKTVANPDVHIVEEDLCYDCAWLSLTALSTVTRNLWL
jgi:hypothetical protein